jgi:hypothetical protein
MWSANADDKAKDDMMTSARLEIPPPTGPRGFQNRPAPRQNRDKTETARIVARAQTNMLSVVYLWKDVTPGAFITLSHNPP